MMVGKSFTSYNPYDKYTAKAKKVKCVVASMYVCVCMCGGCGCGCMCVCIYACVVASKVVVSSRI